VTGRAGLTIAAVLLVACGSGGGGFAIGCGGGGQPQNTVAAPAAAPNDAQHSNVTGPHGDHTPRHGGMVLMNGDIHYEIVFAGDGRHQIWFTDAIRSDLPASIASGVTMEIARPGEPVEVARLAIDDSGEAWVASARPITGEGVMVKVRYALQGTPHEIEVPVVSAKALPQ
jgi:hypothetical protein